MKMPSERKKELREEYKQMKPEMGVIAVINKSSGQHFLEATQNLKGRINSSLFKLNAGGHFNQALQRDWSELGADAFEIEVVEQIKYEENKTKADYDDELELAKLIWSEKLASQNIPLY